MVYVLTSVSLLRSSVVSSLVFFQRIGKSERDGVMLHNMIFLLDHVHTIIYDYDEIL